MLATSTAWSSILQRILFRLQQLPSADHLTCQKISHKDELVRTSGDPDIKAPGGWARSRGRVRATPELASQLEGLINNSLLEMCDVFLGQR